MRTPQQEAVLRVMRERWPMMTQPIDVYHRESEAFASPRGVASSLMALVRAGLVERRTQWEHSWRGGRPSRLRDHREVSYRLTAAGRWTRPPAD